MEIADVTGSVVIDGFHVTYYFDFYARRPDFLKVKNIYAFKIWEPSMGKLRTSLSETNH